MTAKALSADHADWQQQAYQYLTGGDYPKAAQFYQQGIVAQPAVKSNYWYLGLTFLLQGQEIEAQTTWMLGMGEGETEQIDQWTAELVQVLQAQAEQRQVVKDYQMAWVIRQHIREISPADINNLLHLIALSIQLETFTVDELTDLGILELLQSEQSVDIDPDLLLQVLASVLDDAPLAPSSFELAKASLSYIRNAEALIDLFLSAAYDIAFSRVKYEIAADFIELCLQLDEHQMEALRILVTCYQKSGQHEQGIKTAKLYYSLCQTLPDQVFANFHVLRSLMAAGGQWEEAVLVFQQQESLLESLLEENPQNLDRGTTLRLINSTFFFPYFRDTPQVNQRLKNQVSQLCQSNIEAYVDDSLPQPKIAAISQPLKIGYLSNYLRRHSVGWLVRWLFEHHHRNRFKVYTYFLSYKQVNDPLQDWYIDKSDQFYIGGANGREIAEKICQDEIDILVDLDSLTLDLSCEVMALKPAPIQVTWLGWDASGLPAIDYYIADPYVLPELAQDDYSEKIWRLPQTYIAVDGFEVGVPTLRRDELDIPSDAVVYLSAQTGYKRHLDTARLQMQIIKAVPNSYFLIKGLGDQESLKNFFIQIAAAEGVSSERLRFLSITPSEAVHRANLTITDVVLDTYPYNGATTTLETLWMGIPLVTRVGQQFAARNSYTMMMNVGVTEGIAWTEEEYVEWGIRLGKDPALRQQISGKLRQSRQTAPLWNARQFTRELEAAYKQMWTRYLDSSYSL
ncbi:O-linked N-acetylglucosamine transferase, SPINDLY family protein [Coleofasciculus sp. E1-EBD-02]|uniref:O-linked N-acetylglucosamine transferase, SPINDLY family protein n=1 Tax=Coleofasciculus sp. E1-EBD-02 TaxID=3068481 RepID=UPI0032F7D09E